MKPELKSSQNFIMQLLRKKKFVEFNEIIPKLKDVSKRTVYNQAKQLERKGLIEIRETHQKYNIKRLFITKKGKNYF